MIKVGSIDIPHIYLGYSEISAIYCGNDKIYPAGGGDVITVSPLSAETESSGGVLTFTVTSTESFSVTTSDWLFISPVTYWFESGTSYPTFNVSTTTSGRDGTITFETTLSHTSVIVPVHQNAAPVPPSYDDIPLAWIGNGVSSLTPSAKNVYFDTEYVMSGSVKNRAIEIEFEYPVINNSSSTQQVMFGAYTNTSKMLRFVVSNVGSYKIDFGPYTTSYSVTVPPSAGTINLKSWVYSNKLYANINGSINISTSSTITRNGSDYSFYILGQHQSVGLANPCFGGAKIYGLKLYNSVTTTANGFTGSPTREYKPVLHYNGTEYVPCFKETITGTYIYNLGNDSVNYGEIT